MMLFEAVQQVKPGQRIEWKFRGNQYFLQWKHGAPTPESDTVILSDEWLAEATIIDIPKPQPTLLDVLVEGAKRIEARANCRCCKRTNEDCKGLSPSECSAALIYTLQEIALADGFDMRQVFANVVENR